MNYDANVVRKRKEVGDSGKKKLSSEEQKVTRAYGRTSDRFYLVKLFV